MKRKTTLLRLALALAALAVASKTSLADQDVTLPSPIYMETFDQLNEFTLPAGWTVTNNTETVTAGEDPDSLKSDTYKGWVVASADRLAGLKAGIFQIPTITLNGQLVDPLASGNMLYAESDSRDGSQVQYIFTSDYDLTGKTNIYVAFNSLYEQNQDNVNSLEYSIDQGNTWLPALYMVNQFSDTASDNLPFSQADVYFDTDGNIDAAKTLNTVHTDAAYGTSYGAYIAAPITQDLAPYISGRVNDDASESKRIEIIRLAKADNQAKVRFRFMQAGTGSWYWGVDNFGLYSIPDARIVIAPYILPSWGHLARVNVGGSVTFHVTASGQGPISYQWAFNGTPISGATSDTLTISNAKTTDEGDYTVTVQNSLGQATSDPGHITIITTPQIDTQPKRTLVSSGASLALSVVASGPGPISYQWQKDQANIAGATNATFSVASAVDSDAGAYQVIVSNSNGSLTSDEVQVTVFSGPITQDLVLHLPFDTDAKDTSGRNNHGTPESQVLSDGTTDPGPPTFTGGGNQLVGSGAVHILDGQDVTLGEPADLMFSADVNFTVSFWVKAADANAWTDDPAFFSNKNWTDGKSQGYVVAAQGSGTWKWNWKGADADRHDVSFPSIADGKWHNILISHDRQGVASFYVDGILNNTQPIAGDGDIDGFDLVTNIGQDGTGHYGFNNDTGAHFKDIWMDDFGIWRRLVTPQEAASIYAHGLSGEDLTKASGAIVVVPPTVTQQPFAVQYLSSGGALTLSAGVAGTVPLNYQWKKNGQNVSNGTSATLALSNVTAADAGDYTLEIKNSAGTATTSATKVLVSNATSSDDLKDQVVHISFDGNYNDTSGHNNNATPQGSPTLEAGKLGQAMHFTTVKDGSKIDYASLGSPADLNFGDSTDFSTSFWINWASSEDDLPFVSNKDWNSSDNTGWGVFSQSSGTFRDNVTGTPRGSTNKMSVTLSTKVGDGTWHLVTVAFKRGVAAFSYVDGKLANVTSLTTVGTIDAGLATNIGQDGTGKYTDGGSVQMSGLIDDVGIWRRALTADDAAAIFAAGQAGKDLSTFSGSAAGDVRVTGVQKSGANLVFSVSGTGSFQLQKKDSLTDATWTNVGAPVTSGNFSVAISGQTGFFRVVKQ